MSVYLHMALIRGGSRKKVRGGGGLTCMLKENYRFIYVDPTPRKGAPCKLSDYDKFVIIERLLDKL